MPKYNDLIFDNINCCKEKCKVENDDKTIVVTEDGCISSYHMFDNNVKGV